MKLKLLRADTQSFSEYLPFIFGTHLEHFWQDLGTVGVYNEFRQAGKDCLKIFFGGILLCTLTLLQKSFPIVQAVG